MAVDISAPAAAPPHAVESRNPATGELWRRFDACNRDDVFRAVTRARAAQPAWAALPVSLRVRALRRFHESLFLRRQDVALALTRENGKPPAEALATEVVIALDYATFYANRAGGFLRARWTSPTALGMKRKRVRLSREPYGVVGVISPWNYPFMLSAGVVLPALVAGNAVLLKPSELTPSSGELLRDLLARAGVPDDVFQVLQGDGATGAALCDAPVDKLFFTGSEATGRKVAAAAAARLVPASLELGGSDAAIVLADADMRYAANGIAWGRFSNAGQTCVAPKRVYVEAAAYDAFVTELDRATAAIVVGSGEAPGTEVGPMIRPEAVAALEAQRDDAIRRGAHVLGGAGRASAKGDDPAKARWFAPTVLVDVPADARVLHEETFGPLLPVVRVRDAAEAVALANAGEFGLSASIWTNDSARGALLAGQLEAGSVSINDSIITAGMSDVPHGGVKHSGYGRSHGMAGLEESVRTKAIVSDRFPRWRQAWWFGYGDVHAVGMDAFVRLAHSPRILERVMAIPAFLRVLFRSQANRRGE